MRTNNGVQFSAVRAALWRVKDEVLHDHINHRVEHAMSNGDRKQLRKKVAESIDVMW